MENVEMKKLHLRDVLADKPGVADNFPTNYTMPYQNYLRTAFLERRDELIAGSSILFDFPGVGTLTFRGRVYSFVFDPAYAAVKGYGERAEGNWG